MTIDDYRQMDKNQCTPNPRERQKYQQRDSTNLTVPQGDGLSADEFTYYLARAMDDAEQSIYKPNTFLHCYQKLSGCSCGHL